MSSSTSWAFPKIRSALLWFGIGLGVLLVGAWLYPKGLALAYQSRGGRLLEQAISEDPALRSDDFLCPVDPSRHEETRELARQALTWLGKSVALNPRLSQGHLLMGRAYCLLGEYENAKAWYDKFSNYRPGNPLGELESGIAYLALEMSKLPQVQDGACLIDSQPGGNPSNLLSSAPAQFRNSGIESSQFQRIANSFFSHKEYRAAACVYQLIASLDSEKEPKIQFLWLLASELSHGALAADSPVLIPVYQLDDKALIEAPNLRWVDPVRVTGQMLAETSPGYSDLGVMWWNGSAVAVIDVAEPRMFRITIRAQNSSPAPVELQLEHNLEPVANFSLDKGDSSWEELEKIIFLPEGLNLIGIRFGNDGLVGERDRNAYIQWIEIESQ